MSKDKELMVSVESSTNVPAGTRLFEDDPLVLADARNWVRFASGDRAVWKRRFELLAERQAQDVQERERSRAEIRAQGTRPLASDSAITEASKRAVRQNPDLLELAYDLTSGQVIGARPKHRAPVPVVTSGYLAADK